MITTNSRIQTLIFSRGWNKRLDSGPTRNLSVFSQHFLIYQRCRQKHRECYAVLGRRTQINGFGKDFQSHGEVRRAIHRPGRESQCNGELNVLGYDFRHTPSPSGLLDQGGRRRKWPGDYGCHGGCSQRSFRHSWRAIHQKQSSRRGLDKQTSSAEKLAGFWNIWVLIEILVKFYFL